MKEDLEVSPKNKNPTIGCGELLYRGNPTCASLFFSGNMVRQGVWGVISRRSFIEREVYVAENKLYMLCSQIDYLERNKPVHKLV